MTLNPVDLEELRRETRAQLDLTKTLLAELDALEFPVSRPVELVLELRRRLQLHEREILTAQLSTAATASGPAAALPLPPRAQLSDPSGPHDEEAFAVTVPLEVRGARIDPRTATCFRGYYGEDFGDQHQVSSGLVWAPPDFSDAVPDWAMRDAWTQLADDWDELLMAAWERSHPRRETDEQA